MLFSKEQYWRSCAKKLEEERQEDNRAGKKKNYFDKPSKWFEKNDT